MQLFSDATSDKSDARTSDSASLPGTSKSISTGNPGETDSITDLMTARFKHIVTAEGHAIITGRDGETLQRCEDEPYV